MTERDEDEAEAVGTFEDRLLRYAERQTRAQERILLLLEVMLFLAVLAGLIWGIAALGS